MITRHEVLRIKITLTGERALARRSALRALHGDRFIEPRADCEYNVMYQFNCDYMGDIAGKLSLLCELMNDGVTAASIDELQHSRSQILEVVRGLDRVINKLKPRWWQFWRRPESYS